MNKDDMLQLDERLSALADGELAGDELGQLMAQSASDGGRLHATWQSYHVIGDVLRGGEQSAVRASGDFLARLQTRLAAEPPLVPARPAAAPFVEAVPVRVQRTEPANDASFRWKMVAGCASFAAVAALTWSVVGGGGAAVSVQPQLAVAPSPAIVEARATAPVGPAALPNQVEQEVQLAGGEVQIMIRDARLDELVAAHKQAGGSSALQMPAPAGFVRSATFTAPDR